MKIALFEKSRNLAEKQEFYAVDIFRLIAAFMVIAIHYPPFESVNYALSGGFSNILCRLSVPFFFLVSGYFLGEKIRNSQKIISYIKKLVRFYLIYTIIYFPLSFYGFNDKGNSVKIIISGYLRKFFLIGSYSHLWYFLALIVSVCLLYFWVNKIKISDKALVILSLILYVLGVVGCIFETELRSLEFISFPSNLYFDIFDDTKNGLFFGLPFVSFGYITAKNKEKIEFNSKFILLLVVVAVVMCAEKVVEMAVATSVKQDMMISMIPATWLLFLCIAFVKMNESVKHIAIISRKMSVLIYVWHPFVGFCIDRIMEKSGFKIHSLVMYMGVMVISVVIALATIKLSERFKILKQLY